jgi:RimJ/RimL family protein N-acetyltransferase
VRRWDAAREDAPVTALHELPWPRRTERLVLRPPVLADAEAIHAYKSLPDVCRWTAGPPPPLEEFRALVADPEWAGKMLLVERDGEVAGDLYVAVGDAWAQRGVLERAQGVQAHIGWSLAPQHHGSGLATEAVRALLAVLFDELGLRRVVAECFLANEPSWRLMERLGMRREAHAVQDSLHAELGWLDGLTYALLASEWRARRST